MKVVLVVGSLKSEAAPTGFEQFLHGQRKAIFNSSPISSNRCFETVHSRIETIHPRIGSQPGLR